MPDTGSEARSAFISIGKALLGVSFAAMAAFGGASNPGLALALSVPAATLNASESLQPLLAQLKGKKEDRLELPLPPWWSKKHDSSWQQVCASLENRLPAIINATAKQLEQEQSPTQPLILRTFINEIERQVPPWEVEPNQRGLVAYEVATHFLARVADILRMKTDSIQLNAVIVKMDALTAKVNDVANALATLAVQTPVLNPTVASGTPSSSSAPGTPLAADQLQQKLQTGNYDVYICYYEDDVDEVEKIGAQLMAKGILPWLDLLETDPGRSLQAQQSAQILRIQSAAIFVGKHAVEGWQSLQVDALLNEFVKRQIPVIPVLLADAPKKPELPPFLGTLVWVDFHKQHPDPMMRLIWGITGVRPAM